MKDVVIITKQLGGWVCASGWGWGSQFTWAQFGLLNWQRGVDQQSTCLFSSLIIPFLPMENLCFVYHSLCCVEVKVL